jgi:ABC-type dipeptide/oligopeptide/nickel transport system permease subunit
MSLADRFRAYLGSADFAVTTGAVVVALVAGAVAFETLPGETDGYFVVLLAGVAVPGIARDQWQRPFASRGRAVLWGALAAVAVSLAYAGLATAVRLVAGDTVTAIAAFVATWILGSFAARTITNDPA